MVVFKNHRTENEVETEEPMEMKTQQYRQHGKVTGYKHITVSKVANVLSLGGYIWRAKYLKSVFTDSKVYVGYLLFAAM